MEKSPYSEIIEERRDPDRGLRSAARFLAVLLAVVAAVLFVFTAVLAGVQVSGSSMEPTLQSGDYLFVNLLASPDRGDIIVIEEEDRDTAGNVTSRWLIKRVIGLPGDIVWAENGVLYRIEAGDDGTADKESYIVEEDYLNGEWTWKNTFSEVLISEGCVYVLGDNRNNSHDSRSSDLGELELSAMLGVVCGWSVSIRGFTNGLMALIGK